MTPSAHMASSRALLAAFESAAVAASEAETVLRRQLEAEIRRLEHQRAFAHRRLNLMRLLGSTVECAETEAAAVGQGQSAIRAELGWVADSETRTETLSQLAIVIRAVFGFLRAAAAEPRTDEVVVALEGFETWYEARYGQVFWTLFERPVEEMPLVER